MILIKFKKFLYFSYFIIYSFIISKLVNFSFLKKHTLFFNEFVNMCPIMYKNIFSEIYYSGNFISSENNVDIVIANHFNEIDPFIVASVIKKFTNKDLYVIIKKDILKMPIFGHLSRYNLIINRDFNTDKDMIIKYLSNIDNAVVLLYPEGSRMNEDNFKKSIRYSTRNNLKLYNNVLYPKMKGLDLIINELYKDNKMGNLIDITVKIDKLRKFKSSCKEFLRPIGNTYCNINTYKINDKTIDNYENFKNWFLMIWDKKEDFLNNYTDNLYNNLNYKIKSSTFILNMIIINLTIFYINTFTNFSLFKKKI